METITLTVLKPFSQEKQQVDRVQLECLSGGFMVGQGHRPLIAILRQASDVVFWASGKEQTIEVPETGGLVHVLDGEVVLFFC